MNFLSLSFLLTFLFLLQTTFAADEQQQQQQQQVGPPSHLLESVMRNDYDGVRHALENGEDINLVNVDGFSAARVAVELSNLQMLQFLIEHRIDLNNADLNGVTPLMVASQLAQKELVEILLANNANPFQVSSSGQDAFTLAGNSNRKIIPLILAEGSAIYALNHADLDGVLIAIRYGAYPEIRNPTGWTPLMLASFRGSVEAVKELLALGVSVNRVENDNWTALHFAAFNGNKEVIQLLLDHGAKELKNWSTKNNEKPVDIARTHGHHDVEALLQP